MSPQNERTTSSKENGCDWLPRNQVYGQWDPNDDIVIAGISGRFPECDNVEEFMKKLYDGVDMVVENDRRWPIGFCDLPGAANLKDVSKFDAAYFGVPPKLVTYIDPQLRIILELTYEALIDAGMNPAEVRGSKTGVYYALTGGDADHYWSSGEDKSNGYGFLGSCKSMFANRISFQFDFTGPSFAVDTGCATSLIALNQAITDIRVCRVDAAIVCSSNIMLNPFYTQHLYKLGVLASVMEPRVFDANATGYVRGEAAVVMYLVRKSAARRVYANIVHVRNNTNGYKIAGIATPSGEMQYENNCKLYKEAGVDPLEVGYVEAHGTGTKVGDPEELNSLVDLFCDKRSDNLLVGSLKSNMGHSESTAGLCSMMKVVLAMQTGLIPPNLHFKDPNPAVPALFDGRLKIVDKVENLPSDYVGVNAFGLGGSNSHVLMKRYGKVKSNAPRDQLPRLVAVSGRTEEAVNFFLDKIESTPRDDDFVALLHEIHKMNIHKHNYRGYTIVNTSNPTRQVTHFGEETRPIWFICTGWGAQWLGYTKELMKFPVFERRIKMCSKILEREGLNLCDIIMENSETISEDFVKVFVTIGATQMALIDLLRSIGIKPDALIGISTGELTCAYIDGAVTAEQVIQIAYHTARWTKDSNLPSAAMAVVCGLSYEEVKAVCPPGIYVAVHNDDKTCTICGPEEQIPNFVNSLLSQGIVAKTIKSSGRVAFHTPLIATEARVLADKIHKLIPNSRAAGLHWVSSSVPALNGMVPLVEKFSADYFMNIVTGTVLVQEALLHVPDNAIIVEISPHCALQLTLQKVVPSSVISIPLMCRDEPHQAELLLSGIGKLYNAGVQMNLSNLYPKVCFPVSRGTQMINSMVKWDHSTDWFVPNLWYKAKKDGSRPSKLSLTVDVSKEKDIYLKGHVVNRQMLFPAAGYIHLVWKAFAQVNENWYENVSVRFENVEFHEDTVITESEIVSFLVKFSKQHNGKFELFENNRLLISGYIYKLQDVHDEHEEIPESQPASLTAGDIYKDLRLRGFQYSGSFCSIKQSDSKGTSGTVEWQKNWVTFLDSLFQFAQIGSTCSELLLPRRVLALTINLQEHHNLATATDEIGVQMHREMNLIHAGGVKLQGLELYIENKIKEEQNEPEVERQIFIPYVNRETVSLGQTEEEARVNALTVMVQILQNNVSSVKLNIVELAKNLTEKQLLSPHVARIIKKQPECKADVTVISEVLDESTLLESLNIKVNNVDDRDCNLVIGSDFNTISDVDDLLCPGGFVLFEKQLNGGNVEIAGFTLISMQHMFTTAFVLLRKNVDEEQYSVVEVTNKNFRWVGELQAALKLSKFNLKKILVVSQGENECGVLGLVNCLIKEPNIHKLRCIFVQDSTAPKFCETDPFYTSQLRKDLCINVYRRGAWGSLHYLSIAADSNVRRPVESACLQVLNPGDLSTITWVEAANTTFKPENNEVLCHVHYASVSIKDVSDVSGSTKNRRNSLLGQQFSGYTCSGQRVMGLVSGGALATNVMAFPSLLWPVPDSWSLKQAATVPYAYALSFYALVVRGNIQQGEWVLIHSAESTVVCAAVTICLHRGCKVITTMQIEHRHSSDIYVVNCSSMEKQVLALTAGQGVDVILSSEHNARCVAQHGRFLDITFNTSTNLSTSMLQNKIYHNIQIDSLFKARSAEREKVFRLVSDGLDSGIVTPLPAQVFMQTEVESAFRHVKDGESSVVIMKIHEEIKNTLGAKKKLISAIPKLFMDPDKVYVLIGGMGGFGMELAQWLVQRGARKLVLTSRRGITVGYKSLRIRRWQEAGVCVITSTQDVTSEEGAKCLLQKSNKLGHIGGIFILSVVLRDALFENQKEENFQEVFQAKVDVATSLDAVSRRLCPHLEYFVAFSSIASGRGHAGQTPYGMANSALERICEERRGMGLPGLAIQWGPIGDVGVLFDSMGNNVVLVGAIPQNIHSCINTFEQIVAQLHAVVASHVLFDKEMDADSAAILEKDFMNTVANVLGIKDMSTVNANADAEDLGIDSLMSTEIKNTLQEQFNVSLSSQQIYNLMVTTLKEN